MGMGEDKLAKWLQKEGQIMLAIKKKFWFIQEPLDEKTFTWIRKKFQQRECFSEKVLFINLRWRFCKRKEWDFSHKRWGRGRIQGHPWIFILSSSRLEDKPPPVFRKHVM